MIDSTPQGMNIRNIAWDRASLRAQLGPQGVEIIGTARQQGDLGPCRDKDLSRFRTDATAGTCD